MRKWTVVQHSGFGYGGNPQFEQATEVRVVDTATDIRHVGKAGGVVFDSYLEADEFSEDANYPEGYEGLIPEARGTFSDKTIDDLKVYIPVLEAAE